MKTLGWAEVIHAHISHYIELVEAEIRTYQLRLFSPRMSARDETVGLLVVVILLLVGFAVLLYMLS